MNLDAVIGCITGGKPGINSANKGGPSGSPLPRQHSHDYERRNQQGADKPTLVSLIHKLVPQKPKIRFVPLPRSMHKSLDHSPHHVKQGWKKCGNYYWGLYKTDYGQYLGEIEIVGGMLEAYIHKPPPEINFHPKRPCFFERGGGKTFIHFDLQPVDLSPAPVVLAVEKIITESFTRYRRR